MNKKIHIIALFFLILFFAVNPCAAQTTEEPQTIYHEVKEYLDFQISLVSLSQTIIFIEEYFIKEVDLKNIACRAVTKKTLTQKTYSFSDEVREEISKKIKDFCEQKYDSLPDALIEIIYCFLESKTPKQAMEFTNSITKELVKSLNDKRSYFLTQEENEKRKEMEALNKEYVGIGIGITPADDVDPDSKEKIMIGKKGLLILEVFENGPSSKAGLKEGDRIIKITGEDGKFFSLNGISLEEAVMKKIRGTENTEIKLIVLRDGVEKEFSIIRKKFSVKNIRAKKITRNNSNYILIKINSFGTNQQESKVSKKVRSIVQETLGDEKTEGLIIDLRSNPGGLLTGAVKIVDLFVKKDKLVISTMGKEKIHAPNHTSNDKNDIHLPIVILVNKHTASASEIVTAALKFHVNAVVIGEKTYGKGTVQIHTELYGGSLLILTIAKYYLPNGLCIEGIGINPDIETNSRNTEELINMAIKEFEKLKKE